MKVRSLPSPEIHRTGVAKGVASAFGVEIGEKAYKILSSDIYTYKIRAVIREICCNAIDGHIVIGNEDSFDVHMPTVLDPRFIVRDYGVGMDHDSIYDMYTTYFKSSKTDSNDTIGALGLGSKSPLSYSDTFTVESVYGGVKRGYVVYKENSLPYIDTLYEIPTDEHSGITVIVPVNPNDIAEWEKEARRVFAAFTGIRPNFVTADPGVSYLPTVKRKGELFIKTRHNSYNGLYARMGGIMYPIDPEIYNDTLLKFYISDSVSIIDFKIGDLDFQPSRENLSLDRVTLQNLKDKIGAIHNTFWDTLLLQFNERKTVRDKLAFYHNLSSSIQAYVSRKDEFKINGHSIGLVYQHITMSKNLESLGTIPGFWSNYVEASRSDYMMVGRGYTHKSETIRRTRIDKMFSPWAQKNLYIIEVDTKTFKPYLVGDAIIKRDNAPGVIHYVNSSVNPEKLKNIIKFGMYEDSEIIRLKASEMTEQLEAYEKKFPKTEREKKGTRESRPSSPNVVKVFITPGSSQISKENLRMTRDEFAELEGVGLRIYGLDEVSAMKDNSALNLNRLEPRENEYDTFLYHTMKNTGLKEVYFIRNTMWEKESQLQDMDDYLCDYLMDKLPGIAANNHLINMSDYEKYRRLVKMDISLSRFVKNDPMDAVIYKTVKDLVYMENKPPRKLAGMIKKFKKDLVSMEKRTEKAYDKFASLNPYIIKVAEALSQYGYTNLINLLKDKSIQSIIRWK
ncbi:hypothetical protein PHYNN_68 [Pantoea phage Phynn]|nr:hypothetical protein PHYNN_68 [Pantoea phage Phynn]